MGTQVNLDNKKEEIIVNIYAIMDKNRYSKKRYEQKLSDCNQVRNLIFYQKHGYKFFTQKRDPALSRGLMEDIFKEVFFNNISFNEKEINEIRLNNPGIKIIAHPECPPDVIKASDFTGSTSGMIKYVEDNQPKKVMMVTECSMSDNVQVENPNVKFIKPCNLCPHMKKITLPKILDCLENETNEIIISNEIIEKAKQSVERMTAVGR